MAAMTLKNPLSSMLAKDHFPLHKISQNVSNCIQARCSLNCSLQSRSENQFWRAWIFTFNERSFDAPRHTSEVAHAQTTILTEPIIE